jgi:hypothetical protein
LATVTADEDETAGLAIGNPGLEVTGLDMTGWLMLGTDGNLADEAACTLDSAPRAGAATGAEPAGSTGATKESDAGADGLAATATDVATGGGLTGARPGVNPGGNSGVKDGIFPSSRAPGTQDSKAMNSASATKFSAPSASKRLGELARLASISQAPGTPTPVTSAPLMVRSQNR